MDSTNLGNANKIVKHLSKNPLVPWKRLVDLNLDLMSKSEKPSRTGSQNTYQATNPSYSLACKSNSKGVPENVGIQNIVGIESESTKTTVVKDEAELMDDFEEVKMYRKLKVADDIECTSPVTNGQFRNSGENCSGILVHKSPVVAVSVADVNDEGCCELLDEVKQQQDRSSDEPDANHSSSLLEVISNSDEADLATQTEINHDNAKKSPKKTRSLSSICHLTNYRDSNNDDSGIATREYTVYSSKSALIDAETDLDYESDWDDNETSFTADDTEMCESSDDNESEKYAPRILKTSRTRVAEIRLEDSRNNLSERGISPQCHSLDVNRFTETHIPLVNKNIAEKTPAHLLHYLETNGEELNTIDRNNLREFLPTKCSLSKSLHSMRHEHSQVENERCSHEHSQVDNERCSHEHSQVDNERCSREHSQVDNERCSHEHSQVDNERCSHEYSQVDNERCSHEQSQVDNERCSHEQSQVDNERCSHEHSQVDNERCSHEHSQVDNERCSHEHSQVDNERCSHEYSQVDNERCSHEQSQVDNERCSHEHSQVDNFYQYTTLKSVSVDCLVPSRTCNEKMAALYKTDKFDSVEVEFKVSASENKNEGSDKLGEIDFSWETQNKSQQKSVKGNELHFNSVTDNVYVCQHESKLERSINNGRDESAEYGCAQKESHETRRSHELENYKQSKKLTRNPLTSWKHFVDVNLESLAIKNAGSISYSDNDQDRLSVSMKSQSNRKEDEVVENIDLNREYYGFNNIDSSTIHDYISSGIFTECQENTMFGGANQSDEAISCDCVIIDDLRFDEPRDGLENRVYKTGVVCEENVGNGCVFVTLNGATNNPEQNETVSASTSYKGHITCHVEGLLEVAKDEETSLKALSETFICGYQECSGETMCHYAESHHMPETQFQKSGEGYASSQSMRNKYSKLSDDQATMLRESKSEHEHGNILLEATFDNPFLKVQLLPETSRVGESSGVPLVITTTDSAGKYKRTHSKVREKRANCLKPLTKRHCDRCSKSVRTQSLVTHDKYSRHKMGGTSFRHMGSVEVSKPERETKSPESSDIIETGWGKLTDFINRLVNVFNPSVQTYDHREERDYPMLSNVIDTVHEVYAEKVSSHTNKSKLHHKQFHNDSQNLFENDYVYSMSEEQFHAEQLCHKRSRKERRRKESNRQPSTENTIESNEHSFQSVNACKQGSQYNQRVKGQLSQITDTNTYISDFIPTDYTFETTSCVQNSNAWRWVHADDSNPSTSLALTRYGYLEAEMCRDDAGYANMQVQSDIPNSGVSVKYTSQCNVDPASGTGSRVSFNLESRQAKTAVVLDTKHATNEKELSDFFTSNSAYDVNHIAVGPGRRTPRNSIPEKEQAIPSPLTHAHLLAVNHAAHSPMASCTRLSLLTQTLPDALRSARDENTVNIDGSCTKLSQPRRVEVTEDNVDDNVAEVMTDDMLTSSLECLLEMLLQRGKVSQAFVATVQGQVLAKTSGLLVTAHDVSAIVCCLTSSYQGVARVTLLSIAYQCFKLEPGFSLVGRAENSVFVARQGKQTIVVGFAHPSSPGSIIREIQELSLALGHRGL